MLIFAQKNPKKIILIIALIGLVFSVLFSFINGHIYKTDFSDYRTDAEIYNLMALSLIDTGSVYSPDGTYYGSLRAPGYPLFLSLAYSVFRSPLSAFALQALLFIASIFILWAISKRFFKGIISFIPPLLFSLSWFITAFVLRINSDFLGMFLILLSTWSLLELLSLERNTRRVKFHTWAYLALSAVSFSFAVLTRPVMLLFIIPLIIFLFFINFRAAFFYGVIFSLILSPFFFINYRLFNTPTLSDSGVVVAMRGRQLLLEEARFKASLIAATAGDLVANIYLPNYKDNPEPYPAISAVAKERTLMRDTGVPFKEMNSGFFKEGLENIKSNKKRFLASSFFNVIHLHNPPNQNGTLATHFLAEKDSYSLTLRVVLNLFIRIVWFSFISFSIIGGVLLWRKNKNKRIFLIPIYLLILYLVLIHSLLAHAEFRFILGAIPFYLIFFVFFLNDQVSPKRGSHNLEKLLRYIRHRLIKKEVPNNSHLCDIGCGAHAHLINDLADKISQGVGVDIRAKERKDQKVEIKKADLNKPLPLENNTFDVVTMLAVLEHIENDQELLKESYRILKKGGKLLITVPTHANKPVGEFLSYKLRLIEPEHYRDHKRYYSRDELVKDMEKAGFSRTRSHYWEFGMNLYAEGYKE